MAVSRTQGKVGIIFAMSSETHGLEHVLGDSYVNTRTCKNMATWFIGKAQVIVAVSGIGQDRSAETTKALIDNGAQWIINAGLACGLHPNAEVGDVLVASSVVPGNLSANIIPCNTSLISSSPPSGTFGFPIRQGNVVTIDKVICSASDKQAMYLATGAAALDMESYAAAAVCKKQGIPFAAVKSISDPASQDLPSEIATLILINGTINQAMFAAVRPHLWISLCRLRKQSNIAINNLGEVLALMLLRLL